MKSKSFIRENCCSLSKCRKRVSEEYRPLIRFFPVCIQEEKLLLCRVFHLLSVALNKCLSAGYHYASREFRCMCAQLFWAYKNQENYIFQCRVKQAMQKSIGETSAICNTVLYILFTHILYTPNYVVDWDLYSYKIWFKTQRKYSCWGVLACQVSIKTSQHMHLVCLKNTF